MTNWKDAKTQTPTIRESFENGNYRQALYSIERLSNMAPQMITYHDIDTSGMKSTLQLLRSDLENETGYFDPVNPIKPEELSL